MNTKICALSMENLVGVNREVVREYFGQPRIQYLNLWVYDQTGGIIVVVFQKDKVSSFVLYHNNGEVALARNIAPIMIDPTKFENLRGTEFRLFVELYDKPHTDLGSGFPIPIYLSDHGTSYCFQLQKGVIKKVLETPLLDNTTPKK